MGILKMPEGRMITVEMSFRSMEYSINRRKS
jgi:hypothetical protein